MDTDHDMLKFDAAAAEKINASRGCFA